MTPRMELSGHWWERSNGHRLPSTYAADIRAIVAAHRADEPDAPSEPEIKREMERRLTVYALKRFGIAVCLLLWASVASAQVTAVVVNPNYIQFTSLDHMALGPCGEAVVTHYRVEFWLPGDDMVMGTPRLASLDLAKSLFTPVAGTTPVKYEMRLDALGVAMPKGPTYVATVLVKGPAGYSPRSAASNPFNFPEPTPLPRAAGTVEVVKKP